MMDVDHALTYYTISILKVETAHDTARPVMLYASTPRDLIPFMSIDEYLPFCSFHHVLRLA
jgi:hypothetical protein